MVVRCWVSWSRGRGFRETMVTDPSARYAALSEQPPQIVSRRDKWPRVELANQIVTDVPRGSAGEPLR